MIPLTERKSCAVGRGVGDADSETGGPPPEEKGPSEETGRGRGR